MKFVVGLATGVALAAAAYVYATRNENLRGALEGVEADIRAGDTEALQARFEAGFAEVRSQVLQRVGPQDDWAGAVGAEAAADTAGNESAEAATEPTLDAAVDAAKKGAAEA